MTLTNTTSSIQVQGDGVSTTFDYDFYMGGSDTYAVLIFTDGTGATSSIGSSLFSVSDVNNPDGGTFTYPLAGSPISTGTYLTLYRTVPLVNNATIANQGNFAPVIVDGALDYETMALQQLQRQIDTLNSEVDSFLTGSISSVTTGIIANQAVTYPKIQNVGALKILGNPTTVSTTASEISIDSTLTFSGTTLGVTPATASTTAGLFFITSTFANNTSAVTFSSIASIFTDLQVRVRGRGTTSSTNVNVLMRLNGDTGSNYNSEIGFFFGSNTSSQQSLAATSLTIGDLPGGGGAANYVGGVIANVLGYAGSTFFKTVTANGGGSNNTSSGQTNANCAGGLWLSTSAVSSVTVMPASANFATGTFISLYGFF